MEVSGTAFIKITRSDAISPRVAQHNATLIFTHCTAFIPPTPLERQISGPVFFSNTCTVLVYEYVFKQCNVQQLFRVRPKVTGKPKIWGNSYLEREKDFIDEHREEITDFVQSIPGFKECDEEDVETWTVCDAEDCGFQMLNDDEIVTTMQEESDLVDDETDEDEDNNNKQQGSIKC
ncbi:uncharacterized protein TNCV_1250071 [Trichonephila clavipes]|nr:uncharacterized protein TNCV_1250071 [Trichonephila clavipes]